MRRAIPVAPEGAEHWEPLEGWPWERIQARQGELMRLWQRGPIRPWLTK